MSLKQPDGSFIVSNYGEVDVRYVRVFFIKAFPDRGTAASTAFSPSRICLTSPPQNLSTAPPPSSHPARRTKEASLLHHIHISSMACSRLRGRVSARHTGDTRSAHSHPGYFCSHTSRQTTTRPDWTRPGYSAGSCTCRDWRGSSAASRDARTSSSMGVIRGGSAVRSRC